MAYASPIHVAAYNAARATYNQQTKPTVDQVGIFLDECAAEIDVVLRTQGYALPVPTTATSALKFLEGVNAVGAAWKVEVSAPTSDNPELYEQMYRSAMKMLTKGVEFTDIPKDSAQSLPRSGYGGTQLLPIVTASQLL